MKYIMRILWAVAFALAVVVLQCSTVKYFNSWIRSRRPIIEHEIDCEIENKVRQAKHGGGKYPSYRKENERGWDHGRGGFR